MSFARFLRLAPMVLSFAALGCGIPLDPLEQTPTNTCGASSDCGAGAVCAVVGATSACVATDADLPGLLLEIRPPPDSAYGANVAYLVDVAEQGIVLQNQSSGGQVRDFDPALPELVTAALAVHLEGSGTYCGIVAPDRSFPGEVVFRRVPPFVGLSEHTYTAQSTPQTDDDGTLTGHRFAIAIPTGLYDIYVKPAVPDGCTDAPPPAFFPSYVVDQNTSFNIEVKVPRVLGGELLLPSSVDAEGWSIDVLESVSGNVVSGVDVLGPAETTFDLRFDWTDQAGFTPLVRLRPNAGEAAPRIHWDLEALALTGVTEDIKLDLSGLDAPRHVEGQVLDHEEHPVIAFVRIQSTSLSGIDSGTAGFKLDTQTDDVGVFAVDLPPGEYQVYARPVSDTVRGVAAGSLTVPPPTPEEDCFCGQSIKLLAPSVLTGAVVGPAGEAMDSADIIVRPSITSISTYLGRVLAPDPLTPQDAATAPQNGAFALEMDPGEFDFSVRPADGTIYPWLVLARLRVQSTESPTVTDLGGLTVPYPVVLQGTIRAPTGVALPGSIVRAWLPVRDPAESDKLLGVIQIGETEAGIDGSYVLPLPPSLSE